MNCALCKGEMKKGKAPFQIEKNGYHLSFESIPAMVCQQCGESYFEEKEVTAIQKVIKSIDDGASMFSKAA
ncbi:MAG: YgiT-type zinc finger protein [Candidatus Ozemobacteraceae bacterium]